MAAKKKAKKKLVVDNRPAHKLGDRVGAVGRHFGCIGGVYRIGLKCIAIDKNSCVFKDKEGHTFVASVDDIHGQIGTYNEITVQVARYEIYAGVRRTVIR